MQEFFHILVSGVSIGCVYSCLAVALVLVYKTTSHINFAQGEMATFAAYVALALITVGAPVWLGVLGGIVFGFVSGMGVERLVMRRLHNAPHLTYLIACVALFIGINSLSGWVFWHEIKAFPSVFGSGKSTVVPFLSAHEFGSVLTILVVAALLFSFLRYTSVGLAMRATADNPGSARLSGISVDALLTLGWGIAGAVGAMAAILIAPIVFLEPNMMSGVLIYAFAAALIGGLDSIWGAIIGGILVGAIEHLAGSYLVGNDLKLTLALIIIAAVLLLRPQGLLGGKLVTRV